MHLPTKCVSYGGLAHAVGGHCIGGVCAKLMCLGSSPFQQIAVQDSWGWPHAGSLW